MLVKIIQQRGSCDGIGADNCWSGESPVWEVCENKVKEKVLYEEALSIFIASYGKAEL